MIDILMSTYNGAEFLAPQLDSILAQDHREFRVLVRDDGSEDETASLLEAYALQDARIVNVRGQFGNLGPAASFMTLVEQTDADLFMFADQDDVWLQDKISRTLGKMNDLAAGSGHRSPLAVFTDLAVVDAELNVLDPSFWHYQRLDPRLSEDWKSLLAQNVVTGCTLMMNRAARDVLLPCELPEMMHDHWAAARIAKHGTLGFISEPTVLYRQHAGNAEGARKFGAGYAASKLPGLAARISFYRRAAKVFGGISAPGLFLRKLSLNAKRL